MQQVRPTPFDLVFETAAQATFPIIQTALGESGRDPRDRDGFLMLREVIALLRELLILGPLAALAAYFRRTGGSELGN